MSSNRIRVDELAAAVQSELDNYSYLAATAVQEIIHETSEETADAINGAAPVRTGRYSKSWHAGYEKQGGKKYSETVYADGNGYRIAHLLENGHAKLNGGRTRPITHIMPASVQAEEKIVQRIKEALEGK